MWPIAVAVSYKHCSEMRARTLLNCLALDSSSKRRAVSRKDKSLSEIVRPGDQLPPDVDHRSVALRELDARSSSSSSLSFRSGTLEDGRDGN
mmetsp:Transcript_5854/g.17093  ORF Transcript_5854/g.17093 Transcript_5854/m.17093 type:complete len:92 (-) Transcript_5854:475-750(-)